MNTSNLQHLKRKPIPTLKISNTEQFISYVTSIDHLKDIGIQNCQAKTKETNLMNKLIPNLYKKAKVHDHVFTAKI